LVGNPLTTLLTAIALIGAGTGCAATGLPVGDPMQPPGSMVAFAETASCAQVRASCTGAEAMVVRGHAENLRGLDGAHVRFAIRYLTSRGEGLDVPHGVAAGASVVREGAFESCVCVPQGANSYPQVAAVIFAPNSTEESPATVERAVFSQRYATLGDENVGYILNGQPTLVAKVAALAALEDRVATLSLTDSRTLTQGDTVIAGLVSTERPIAAQTTSGVAVGNDLQFRWIMPGRLLSNERVAWVIDRNHNNHCDAADVGGFGTASAAQTLSANSLTPLTGAALIAVCDALMVGVSRE
jgi:hypothetical protein